MTRSVVATWAVRGLLAGMALPTIFMAPELVRRLIHSVSGGVGESAMWGEPLFYLVLLWIPAGLSGAALGALAAFARLWWEGRA